MIFVTSRQIEDCFSMAAEVNSCVILNCSGVMVGECDNVLVTSLASLSLRHEPAAKDTNNVIGCTPDMKIGRQMALRTPETPSQP